MKLINFDIDTVTDLSSWRSLTIFAAYRLFLAIVLFGVFYQGLPPSFLGSANPQLYSWISQFYVFVAIVFLIFTGKRWGMFLLQTSIQLVLDIFVITLLLHASGGLTTGLGSLLVVVVVAGGTLVPSRMTAFIAATATLSVLLEVGYTQIAGDGITKYSHAGMLGATFFATALLAQLLSRKMQKSQRLVEQREQDVANLALLNQHIISRMQTGVLVVDSAGNVTLSNKSARLLLGINESDREQSDLKILVPELAKQIWNRKHSTQAVFEPFQARTYLPEVSARTTELDSGEILIYIENSSATAQQAQQLKLASLGRLTASIAHEIRNPLASISHAGEILAESNSNSEKIIKLTDIIQRNSVRVNDIIETILQMSRRKTVEKTTLVLVPWIEKLIKEFCEIKSVDDKTIIFVYYAPLAKIQMDAGQLRQVMWNLLENAWHYSKADNSLPQVQIKLDIDEQDVTIDVSDNGTGVSEKAMSGLFEPFHSQRQGGTGLGLYLARELCQANGARLNYLLDENKRCCFRISFPIEQQENLK
ncbi:MAG: PAS domain-containing sensor histidine kinase [Methylophaga sp.]|nr:MAG: PAS domain-containing sensor histidine kinase [Methylophaga sp.]